MTDWQPIETAPKDGTEILGWREDAGVMLIRWDCAESFVTDAVKERADGEWLWAMDWFCADFVGGARLEGSEVPTHWMPLPEPPKETEQPMTAQEQELIKRIRLLQGGLADLTDEQVLHGITTAGERLRATGIDAEQAARNLQAACRAASERPA